MSGSRGVVKDKVQTEEEKYSRYKEKLQTLIENRQTKAAVMTKEVLQAQLLSDNQLTVEEMTDLLELGVGLKPACDKQSELTAGRNLRDIERVGQLELRESRVSLQKVEDCRYSKEMVVRLVPHTDFPHVTLQMVLQTEEDRSTQGDLPTIRKLVASVDGLDEDNNLSEAISYCEENLEPQLLTGLVKEYLPLHQEILQIVEKADKEFSTLTSDRGDYMLELSNSRGSLLATIKLRVKFSQNSLSFSPWWRCRLTEAGRTVCSSLNIPAELADNGRLECWDWQEAVDNLVKVARLDLEDTPSKEFDASNVNTDTPICGAKKILTKRKL